MLLRFWVEDPTNRQTYEDMRLEHGFRVTDYKIDTDANPPRACFEFSDPPARTVSDFAPYFQQDPGQVQAVTVEGTNLGGTTGVQFNNQPATFSLFGGSLIATTVMLTVAGAESMKPSLTLKVKLSGPL